MCADEDDSHVSPSDLVQGEDVERKPKQAPSLACPVNEPRAFEPHDLHDYFDRHEPKCISYPVSSAAGVVSDSSDDECPFATIASIEDWEKAASSSDLWIKAWEEDVCLWSSGHLTEEQAKPYKAQLKHRKKNAALSIAYFGDGSATGQCWRSQDQSQGLGGQNQGVDLS